MCLHVRMCTRVQVPEVSNPLDLELQAVVIYMT